VIAPERDRSDIAAMARLAAPLYREAKWEWSVSGDSDERTRVPDAADLAVKIAEYIEHLTDKPCGYAIGSGGIVVKKACDGIHVYIQVGEIDSGIDPETCPDHDDEQGQS
jgi:hypothetical protein